MTVHDHPLGALLPTCRKALDAPPDASAGGHASGRWHAPAPRVSSALSFSRSISASSFWMASAPMPASKRHPRTSRASRLYSRLGQQLLLLQRGETGVGDDVVGEVEHLLQLTGADVQHQADAAGDALEIPDVRNGCGQLDVAHALTANLGAGDFNAAACRRSCPCSGCACTCRSGTPSPW